MTRQDPELLSRRVQLERGRHRSVDAGFEMVERDGEVGGGIIAGALAYRLMVAAAVVNATLWERRARPE